MQPSSAVTIGMYEAERQKTADEQTKELGNDEFLQLFVAQLQNQDPLSPMDNSQFLQQTSSFSSLEQLTKISDNMQKLVDGEEAVNDTNEMFAASNFIGKRVEYEGSLVSVGETGAEFAFEPESAPFRTTVSIFDSSGQVVKTLYPEVSQGGKTTVSWDGKNLDGQQVEPGLYAFAVSATDAYGEELEVTTYAAGNVRGLDKEDGKIFFNVDGAKVEADKVIAVTQQVN